MEKFLPKPKPTPEEIPNFIQQKLYTASPNMQVRGGMSNLVVIIIALLCLATGLSFGFCGGFVYFYTQDALAIENLIEIRDLKDEIHTRSLGVDKRFETEIKKRENNDEYFDDYLDKFWDYKNLKSL